MSDFIQHIIIDDTLKRIGETAFADYLCHAYCYGGHCTFERPRVGGQGPGMRNGQTFRFEPGDCMIIARRGDLVMNLQESIDEYDTIILGYPNWWGTMPMVCYTFLESYDFTGKRIIPFCTNEGSGMGSSVRFIKKLCPGATVEDGISIHGAEAANADSEAREIAEMAK